MPQNAEYEEVLILREIKPGDNVTGLSLGSEEFVPLKTFLKKDASHFHENQIAKTYVLVPEEGKPQVRGYISLMCSEVKLEDEHHPEDLNDYPYTYFPAIKIARLAIDRRVAGQGYGRQLVEFALTMARDDIMSSVGCRFVIVDSKRSATGFYEKYCGFSLHYDSEDVREHHLMFVDLQKI